MHILVTGAKGFIGTSLCRTLSRIPDVKVEEISRTAGAKMGEETRMRVADFTSDIDFLTEIDVVVHLAARVHIMDDKAQDPLEEFRKVNVMGTINLARQAAQAGVKRFIFLSSVKVNGEQTFEQPFSERDVVAPQDPYGISKWEAEQALREIEAATGMEVVIIRPPLVYGPGVKANFRRLIQLVNQGIPLPFKLVNNKRSLIGLSNLVDFIILCTRHPKAAGEAFLISDGEDMSTAQLIGQIAQALHKPARLLPVPVWIMRSIAAVCGKKSVADRVLGSLQVDSAKARRLLGWKPVKSVQQELDTTVKFG